MRGCTIQPSPQEACRILLAVSSSTSSTSGVTSRPVQHCSMSGACRKRLSNWFCSVVHVWFHVQEMFTLQHQILQHSEGSMYYTAEQRRTYAVRQLLHIAGVGGSQLCVSLCLCHCHLPAITLLASSNPLSFMALLCMLDAPSAMMASGFAHVGPSGLRSDEQASKC